MTTQTNYTLLWPCFCCSLLFLVSLDESADQVKELEQILRSRNPNSIPALIYAVANADKENEASRPGSINALLERRVQHLEAELESHEQEAKRSLQSMEQQFQRIKVTPSCLLKILGGVLLHINLINNDCVFVSVLHRVQLCYEQQICALDKQLKEKQQPQVNNSTAAAAGSGSQTQSLEEKLQREKKAHLEKEVSLQKQIESLRLQLKQKVCIGASQMLTSLERFHDVTLCFSTAGCVFCTAVGTN